MSRSIGRRFDRNDMRKMWISLENENSRLVFMQVTSTKTNLQGIKIYWIFMKICQNPVTLTNMKFKKHQFIYN